MLVWRDGSDDVGWRYCSVNEMPSRRRCRRGLIFNNTFFLHEDTQFAEFRAFWFCFTVIFIFIYVR
jgi:hypothetical protein